MKNFIYYDEGLFVKHERDEDPAGVSYTMHTHELFEIYYFLSGNMVFWAEGTPYQLQSGDIMLFNISEAHTIELKGDSPYERVAINFSRDIFDRLDPERILQKPFTERALGKGNLIRPKDFEGNFWRECIEKIIAPTDDRRLQALTYLPALLGEIYQASSRRHKRSVSEKNSTAAKVISYINQNLAEPLSVDALSKRFYISKSRLHTVFKEATGSSVWEYITVKRLMLARGLLHMGEKPTAVCAKCGFNDYTVFFRAYRRRFGVSPKQDSKIL